MVKECLQLGPSKFSKIRNGTFDHIDTSTWELDKEAALPIAKYLHLKSSDNDLSEAIDSYLRVAYDSGVVYVSFSLRNVNK